MLREELALGEGGGRLVAQHREPSCARRPQQTGFSTRPDARAGLHWMTAYRSPSATGLGAFAVTGRRVTMTPETPR